MLPEREITSIVKDIFKKVEVPFTEPEVETFEQIMARTPETSNSHVSVLKFEPKATDLSVVKPRRRELKPEPKVS